MRTNASAKAGEGPFNLNAAKHQIDILGVLEDKTHGNLAETSPKPSKNCTAPASTKPAPDTTASRRKVSISKTAAWDVDRVCYCSNSLHKETTDASSASSEYAQAVDRPLRMIGSQRAICPASISCKNGSMRRARAG